MYARISRKKYNIFAFDIESHNDEESIAKKETSMWLGAFINEESKVDDESSYIYSMEELFQRLELLSSGKRKHGESKRPCKNVCVFVYNLSFEWSFMLPILLKQGFTFKAVIEKDDEYVFNTISTKSVSSVWQIKLKFGAKSGDVVFHDLAKIYGGGLGKVAKSFGIKTQKGEIDYRKNRLHNHKITKQEKIYTFNDTRIIVDILLEMIARGDKFFFSSLSMASYSMKMMIKTGYQRSTKPYAKYRENYPELGEEETTFLRHACSGGITYAPSKYQFKHIKQKVAHIDAHSMHPSSAYLNLFPYGYGEYRVGEPNVYTRQMNCCHVKISYSGVKIHSVIQLIGIEFIEGYELWLWDFEIATMKKCYEDLEIEYIDYYAYKMKPLAWRKYYADCFNGRVKAKNNNDEFLKLYYKLLMNSSYGKALEWGHTEIFENYIDEEGIIDSKTITREKPSDMSEDDWKLRQLNAKYTYLPYGSCIPAYSRCALVELALKIGYDKIVYLDTDSIFFIWDKDTESNYHKYADLTDFLGGWNLEEMIDQSQFTAPKRYKTLSEGITTIKAGGINFTDYLNSKAKEEGLTSIDDIRKFREKYQFSYDEINLVNSSWNVQRAYRVKGGTIIEFQKKEISVPKKYIDIYKNNT